MFLRIAWNRYVVYFWGIDLMESYISFRSLFSCIHLKNIIMNLKTYTFIFLILFINSCNEKAKIEDINFDFIKTFSGKVDNKHPLHMKISSENGEINGTYFYDKVGTDIKIESTISKYSIIKLNEFDAKGNQTGLWSGKLINENKIKGTWSKPNGDSVKDFIMILTSDNYDSLKKVIFDNMYSKYNGTYNSPFNDSGISFGKLTIKHTENNEIEFDISTAHQTGCTGELKGIAKINSNGIAVHSSANCESLTFEFKNSEVIVDEKNCDLHGMRCFFTGNYIK